MLYKLKEIFCYNNSADHVLWNRVFQNIFGIKCRELLPSDDWFAKIIFNFLPMSCNLFWILKKKLLVSVYGCYFSSSF